jgi:hypothetical protein
MLEEYFNDTLVLSSIRSSILQKSLENFAQYLMRRGHTPRMMKEYLRVAVHFVYWFENEGNLLPMAEDEIDWRKGVLRIHHGKGQRVNLLPISADIGRAIAQYIRHDRPSTQQRNVFVRHRPPIGESIKSCTVQAIIRRSFKRSGITTTFMGSHMLRHTAASRMVQAGVSIKGQREMYSINLCIPCLSSLATYTLLSILKPECPLSAPGRPDLHIVNNLRGYFLFLEQKIEDIFLPFLEELFRRYLFDLDKLS